MEIPRIDIKITRAGNKLKFKVGDYQLVLNELEEGKSQCYDFLTLEQFITNTARLLYQDIVDKERIKENIRKSFLEGGEEASEAKFVEGLLAG